MESLATMKDADEDTFSKNISFHKKLFSQNITIHKKLLDLFSNTSSYIAVPARATLLSAIVLIPYITLVPIAR
jgi:hypothetical protein